MKNYIKLGQRILKQGIRQETRLVSTLALHNQSLSFDLTKGFPLMTTKHVGQKSIIVETLWYLKGHTNIEYLNKNNVHVWDMFADEHGEIGKTYSYQFRNFNGVDQVMEVINKLNQFHVDGITDRRAIINLYNTAELNEMSIPPCITMLQFHIYKQKGKIYLDSTITQRSADFCLGVPYDIAEMALLTHIIATYVKAIPKNMTIFYANIHVYEAHIEVLKEQLQAVPQKLPTLIIDRTKVLETKPEDLELEMFTFIDVLKTRKKYYYELF